MRKQTPIAELLRATEATSDIEIAGWVRTRRDAKEFSFLELNDGSCLANLQAVLDSACQGFDSIRDATTGSAVRIRGDLVTSLGKGQRWEVRTTHLEIVGRCPEDYPLQKKRHGDEFLRTIAHLRSRTNKFGAMFRIRSRLSYAVHQFFQDRGFHYIHTPIVTGLDCEGAGEMFRVSTIDPHTIATQGKFTYADDFFGKAAHLTVSGQLAVETYCLALSKVYTFGPTFRSENSNTSRHAAEFWMIEPEIAFADLDDDMRLAEEFVRYLVAFLRSDCRDDLALFNQFVDPELEQRLDNIQNSEFVRLSYTDAIDILLKSNVVFEFAPRWGADLQSEHERYLAEQHFKGPVFVHDWPTEIKAFYMRNNDDGRTVAAMDLLMPKVGELIGGSQREERLETLQARLLALGFRPEDYWWYLDTRRFGTAPHAGFGLGFERFLMLVTGVSNIRDVIPFPRTPNNLEF
ncbi:MAG: asparagine--tRNA ligase [Gammaproteobacteria bacterium]|nr:asparagine--tRNA ligase [Gammaproteobacteria bacterium]